MLGLIAVGLAGAAGYVVHKARKSNSYTVAKVFNLLMRKLQEVHK